MSTTRSWSWFNFRNGEQTKLTSMSQVNRSCDEPTSRRYLKVGKQWTTRPYREFVEVAKSREKSVIPLLPLLFSELFLSSIRTRGRVKSSSMATVISITSAHRYWFQLSWIEKFDFQVIVEFSAMEALLLLFIIGPTTAKTKIWFYALINMEAAVSAIDSNENCKWADLHANNNFLLSLFLISVYRLMYYQLL